MLILIGVTLAVCVFVLTVIASAGRRSGLLELGAVSTQWLAEHREYQEGADRDDRARRRSGDARRVSRLPHRSDQRTGSAWHRPVVLALPEVRRRVESGAPARSKPAAPPRTDDAAQQHQRLLAQ